jgi:peptidoglycan hydrolase CwlO-like protein
MKREKDDKIQALKNELRNVQSELDKAKNQIQNINLEKENLERDKILYKDEIESYKNKVSLFFVY